MLRPPAPVIRSSPFDVGALLNACIIIIIIGCRNIHLERCRTRKRQLTVLHQGPKMWNSLSTHLRESPSVNVFMKRMKTSLINKII